jgi:hypothetical protein
VSPDIAIEPGSESQGICADCGRTTRTIWGYVRSQRIPRAVYYVRWTEGHADRGATFTISIGQWGEGTSPADRQHLTLQCRVDDEGPGFMVVDSAKDEGGILGAGLSRAEALGTPIAEEAFAIVDRILEEEERLPSFLGPGPDTSL